MNCAIPLWLQVQVFTSNSARAQLSLLVVLFVNGSRFWQAVHRLRQTAEPIFQQIHFVFSLKDSVQKYAKLILKANLWNDSIALLPAFLHCWKDDI